MKSSVAIAGLVLAATFLTVLVLNIQINNQSISRVAPQQEPNQQKDDESAAKPPSSPGAKAINAASDDAAGPCITASLTQRAEPTPGPGAMTIYAVSNPNATSIDVRHIITDQASFRYEFTTTIAAGCTKEFHLRDMPEVGNPFVGAMTLQSDQQFTAAIIGYDQPSSNAGVATNREP